MRCRPASQKTSCWTRCNKNNGRENCSIHWGNLKRTEYCGELRGSDEGREVVLMGWVHRRRDLGNLIFIDLRDRIGLVQVVFNKEKQPAAHAKAEELRSEFVVAVRGRVVKRAEGKSGIEQRRNRSDGHRTSYPKHAKTPPFQVEDEVTASEETRLRYRYLDLRRPGPRATRTAAPHHVRNSQSDGRTWAFYEIETPMLTRVSPEGARDYLVPSRVHHGQFYALPQSPQIFKQILMISGLDRYFQIVRCFRDEDLRADRQPEFTQLDVEISFPTQDTIFDVIEKVMVRACAIAGVKATAPFRHMEYQDAIRRYGSDKPDLRFGMELHDVSALFAGARETVAHRRQRVRAGGAGSGGVFPQAAGRVRGAAQKRWARAGFIRRRLRRKASRQRSKRIWARKICRSIVAAIGAKAGDLIVAVAAKEQIPGTESAALIAGQLRLHLAEQLH